MSRERVVAAQGGPVVPDKAPPITADQNERRRRQRFMPPVVRTISDAEIAHAERPSTQMAVALAYKSVYGGTVSGAEKAKRRARGKRDRAARKAAR